MKSMKEPVMRKSGGIPGRRNSLMCETLECFEGRENSVLGTQLMSQREAKMRWGSKNIYEAATVV